MSKRRRRSYESLEEYLAAWKEDGKTQEEFAESFGISVGHLSELKNRRVGPSWALAKRFRNECHIPLEAFLPEDVS